MLLKKKNSKKEFQNKISKLEEENIQLKNNLLINKSPDNLLSCIYKYLDSEQVEFLIYNKKTDSFVNTISSSNLNVITDIPNNLNAFYDLIHIEDLDTVKQTIEKLNSKKSVKCRGRISIQRENSKETKPIDFTFIDEEDKKIIIVVKDISILVKHKREIDRIKDKAEESDKLKTSLLSNISHQIRTPLNSITGFSELLAGSEIDQLKRKEYIDIIKQQSKRILNLIDDISEISKLESGRIILSKIPCNLNLLLNELLISLNQQRTANRKELVELELVMPESKGAEILSDAGRLQQALFNIINFSLRYTQQGTISFGYSIDKENKKIDFYIHDTSDGLTKEEQKVIFKRFTILDNTDNLKLEDPGLGLTISREIIRALGGKIWVESEKNKGTSFFFNIPYEEVPKVVEETISDETIEEKEEEAYHWGNNVILIVDDEDVNAMFLDAVFQITGVQTIFAKNGEQAIELIKNINKIDLVLMDLKMPVMNGIKATEKIREFNTTIPIIAQTAMASEENKHKSVEAGCNDIITKPIEVEELLILVNSYLSD